MIYKLFRPAELAAFIAAGETPGAAVDLRDGFIHFSTADQLAETAAKHFSGEADIWLVACDDAAFSKALRWEPSRGGALFPHVYRPLRRADVAWIRPVALRGSAHRFPDLA